MIKLPNKEKCCACGACVAVCPKQAISMRKDEYGFEFPSINYKLCVGCKKCLSICCFDSKSSFDKENIITYAAAARDRNLLSKSTSGGVFSVVAKSVLEDNGVVYGAAWNTDFSVNHIGVDAFSDICKIQGSKYTQSHVYKLFPGIKENLSNNRKVLFSGTPCQVAALYSYLGKDYKNLYTIDLICHGVSSNQMLQDDIKSFEEKKHGKAIKVSFRTKESGWGTDGSIELTNGKFPYNIIDSPYYYYYLTNTIFRDSCYNCRFAGKYRQGDLTIGDYWRVETAHPNIDIDETKGISCVLVNSLKGQILIQKCEERLFVVESTFEKIKARNGQLVAPCRKPKNREEVLSLYATRDYKQVIKYWKKDSRMIRFKEILKGIVPLKIKRKIKRLMQ